MDNCITSIEGSCQILRIVCVEAEQASAFDGLGVALVLPARDQNHFMPTGNQVACQMSANKTSSAGNRYFHITPPVIARNREETGAKEYPEEYRGYTGLRRDGYALAAAWKTSAATSRSPGAPAWGAAGSTV